MLDDSIDPSRPSEPTSSSTRAASSPLCFLPLASIRTLAHLPPTQSTHTIMDDFFNPPTESDPTADFLARERAALGGDDFGASIDSSSFDKDFEQSASAFPDLDAAGDDLVGFTSGPPEIAAVAPGPYEGGMGAQVSVTGNNEFAAFEQDYPEVDIPSQPQVSACTEVTEGKHRVQREGTTR